MVQFILHTVNCLNIELAISPILYCVDYMQRRCGILYIFRSSGGTVYTTHSCIYFALLVVQFILHIVNCLNIVLTIFPILYCIGNMQRRCSILYIFRSSGDTVYTTLSG